MEGKGSISLHRAIRFVSLVILGSVLCALLLAGRRADAHHNNPDADGWSLQTYDENPNHSQPMGYTDWIYREKAAKYRCPVGCWHEAADSRPVPRRPFSDASPEQGVICR